MGFVICVPFTKHVDTFLSEYRTDGKSLRLSSHREEALVFDTEQEAEHVFRLIDANERIAHIEEL